MSHDHDHDHKNMVPPVPLKLAIGLVILTVVGVIWQRVTTDSPDLRRQTMTEAALADPIESILLQFEDGDAGAVIVRAVATGEVLDTLAAGEGGFLRGTLRGLTRERRLAGASKAPGFLVQQFDGGRVLLVDTATSTVLDLRAYGQTNANDFLRYLPSRYSRVSVAELGIAHDEGE
ncbi:MAG: photosynthetic complex assembly protein PuhC [Pseudomonadota bacterium]